MSQIADGHYQYQSPIDAYGNGGFRFADMSHIGSILCLPSGMHKWEMPSIAAVTTNAFDLVWKHADEIDVFLFGTGNDIAFIDDEIRDEFRARSIIMEPMSTGAAVRTYNVLFNEQRAVAAGFIAVERAK